MTVDILSALLRQTRQQWQSKVGWLAIYINKQYCNTNCITTKEEYAHQTKNYCASASGHTIYYTQQEIYHKDSSQPEYSR